MKTFLLSGAIVACLANVGFADAASIYASGPVYAGQSANDPIACRFFNPSQSSITFTDIAIINNLGQRVNLTGNNCGGSIAPLHACAFTASSPGNQSFSCYGVISGTGTRGDLTGTAELRTTSGTYVTQPILRQQ